jgi:hypothetical protein
MKPWPDGTVSLSFVAQGAVSNIVATLQQAATHFRQRFPGYTFSDLTPLYRMDDQGNLVITIVATAMPPAA